MKIVNSKTQSIKAANACATILNEKFPANRIFKINPEIEHVRSLKKFLYEGYFDKLDVQNDPHVITGALLQILKDMDQSLFHDIYDDFLTIEVTEDVIHSKLPILHQLNKLDVHHVELVRSLFVLLFRVSRQGSSELNSFQLAQLISPYICKRNQSAFMSIRHIEDLRKIKPIINFIIDNLDDFLKEIRPSSVPITKSIRNSYTRSNQNIAKLPTPQDMQLSSNNDSYANQYPRETSAAPRMPLKVATIISPIITTEFTDQLPSKHPRQHESVVEFIGADFIQNIETEPKFSFEIPSPLPLNATIEWKIIEALAKHKLESFLKYESESNIESTSLYKKIFLKESDKKAKDYMYSVTNSSEDYENEIDNDDAMTIASDASNTIGLPSNSVSSLEDLKNISNNLQNVFSTQKDSKRKFSDDSPKVTNQKEMATTVTQSSQELSERRKMVIECRSLRNQIANYEDGWMKEHGRLPKAQERGNMNSIYSKYKDMKRSIRDCAAIDIQKNIRRFLLRKKYLISYTKLSKSLRIDLKSENNLLFKDLNQTSSSLSSIPVDIYAKYKYLLGQKRELKRKLKKFDEEFLQSKGRPPNKADKEIMRPLYTTYHEVKAELDSLQSSIESSHGLLPDEFKEDSATEFQGSHYSLGSDSKESKGEYKTTENSYKHINSITSNGDNTTSSGCLSSDNPIYSSGEKRYDDRSSAASKKYTPSNYSDEINSTNKVSGGNSSGSFNYSIMESKSSEINIPSLLEEKKNLHSYLKAYERDFNRNNGRPVMRPEDIQPVAHEYERYKTVKLLLKNNKGAIDDKY